MALTVSILFPLFCGISMLLIKKLSNRNLRMGIIVAMEAVQTLVTLLIVFSDEMSTGSFDFAKGLSVGFYSDMTAKLFCLIVSVAWLLVTVYACIYMKHEKNESRFFQKFTKHCTYGFFIEIFFCAVIV